MIDNSTRRILVVCTANRCRSPMAEGLIRARLAHEDLADQVVVASAGTWAADGVPPTDHAIAAMAEREIDISAVTAAEITVEAVVAADLILTMTEGHRTALMVEFPAARGKTFLISALAGGRWDIADPIGGSLSDYRATANELARLVDSGWDLIVGAATAKRPPAASRTRTMPSGRTAGAP